MKETVLGIDIGGSHITSALVDLETRSILESSFSRRAVDCKDSAEQILTSWCEVIRESLLTNGASVHKIGIAMPGPFDYEEGICLIEDQDKFRALFRVNIKEALASRLGLQPEDFKFVNDAAGFLQGEAFSGAARNAHQVIGLTLGTGLGSAFFEGSQAMDAALWQSPYRGGIAEDYLTTRWFVSRYKELTGRDIAGVRELVQSRDEEATKQAIFDEFAENLSEFLIPIVKERGAELIVIGGNISNAHALFLPAVANRFKTEGITAALRNAELQENASLIGAASCWEFQQI